ncbi:molecular chaperone TorD [Oligella ureolytica]
MDNVPNLSFSFYPAMGQLLLSYIQIDAEAMLDSQDDGSTAKVVEEAARSSANGNHTLH